ncbi:MAG: ATP-binding protein [bacterium]
MNSLFLVGWMLILNAAVAFRFLLHLGKPSKKRTLILFFGTAVAGIGGFFIGHFLLKGTGTLWQNIGLVVLLYLVYRLDFNATFLTAMLSYGIVFILYIPCIVIVLWLRLPFNDTVSQAVLDYLSTPMIGILVYVFVRLLFRLPRLRNGVPYLIENRADTFGSFLAFGILVVFNLISFSDIDARDPISVVYFVTVLLLGLLTLLWIQMRIRREYIARVREREMQNLSMELSRQMSENERLSSLLHRDNKLLSAMTLAVDEALDNPSDTANAAALQAELRVLSKERLDTVRRYELEIQPLPKTGLASVDMQLSYMQKRAAAEGIFLDCVFDGSICQIVPKTLTETELVTILADLLENAIHATVSADGERIFLCMGTRSGSLFIEVSDTGVPFPAEVAAAYGKGRFTTRAAEGGTGIGLATIHDILKKRRGSFQVLPLPENAPYTKTIRITFE